MHKARALWPRARYLRHPCLLPAVAAAALLLFVQSALAQSKPYLTTNSRYGYEETVKRLEAAVAASPLNVVTRASATRGAASLGVRIPGNLVLGVFAPTYAVRMLRASVDAGFEAPVRLYVVEHPGGAVELRYRQPSVLFAPYRNAELDAMAGELDGILEQIAGALR